MGEWIFRRGRSKRLTYAWAPDPSRPNYRRQKSLPAEITSERAGWAYVKEHREAIRAGAPTPRASGSRGLTIAEISKRWIELRRADNRLQGSTIRDSESHLKVHIEPAFGPKIVSEADVPALRKFVRELRGRVAPLTAHHVLSTFAIMLDDAMGEGWIPLQANPCRLKAVRDELPEAKPVAGRSGKLRLSLESAQRVIDATTTPDERRVRYIVDLTTSCRDGELAGAQIRDVRLDVAIPSIRIERALRQKRLERGTGLGKTKTDESTRTLPLHPAAVEALRWWILEGWERHVGCPPTAADPLFPNKTGRAWRPKSAKFFREDLKAAGLDDTVDGHNLTFHAVRRSCASALQAAGVPEDARQAVLGHAPKTTGGKHYEEIDLALLAGYVARLQFVWPGPGGRQNSPIPEERPMLDPSFALERKVG